MCRRSSIFSEVSSVEVKRLSADLLQLLYGVSNDGLEILVVSHLLCIFELPTLTKDNIEYKMLKIITYPLICTKAASQACQQEGQLGMLDSVLVSIALGECAA